LEKAIAARLRISELRQELARANSHIREGQERIARQAELVRGLDANGQDTTDAELLLHTMNEAVNAMDSHRQHIVRELLVARKEQQ
jgi:hypothetical protein